MIVPRYNLHVSNETKIKTHIGRIVMSVMRVCDLCIELILLKVFLIHVMTFHLRIYDTKLSH